MAAQPGAGAVSASVIDRVFALRLSADRYADKIDERTVNVPA